MPDLKGFISNVRFTKGLARWGQPLESPVGQPIPKVLIVCGIIACLCALGMSYYITTLM